jgi:hypothetical protein
MDDRTKEMATTIQRQTQKILELHETVKILNNGILEVCDKNLKVKQQAKLWRAVAHRLFHQRNELRRIAKRAGVQ